jgi:hypothetical protein
MDKYFITKGKERKGPVSIDELIKMELTDDYLIWKDGFEKWIPITEVVELKGSIIISPPPTPNQIKRTNKQIALRKASTTTVICLFIIWVVFFLLMGGYKSDIELKDSYGYGEYAIFGDGNAIRESLIWSSLLISLAISCIIFCNYSAQYYHFSS